MEGTRNNSPWLPCLLTLTFLHLFLFVGLTYLQLSDIKNIDEIDSSLERRIQSLQATINDIGNERQKRDSNFITEIMVQQEQVIAQHCISRNKTCLKGTPGEPGVKGDIGMKGTQGDPGNQGQTGVIGLPGYTGVQGEGGVTGMKGDEGDSGTKGVPGNKGQKGTSSPPGQKGETGDVGARGVYGLPGLQGIRGDQGVTGDNGPTGNVGEVGPHGINGSKGDTGETGINGGDKVIKPENGCLCIKPSSARANIHTADKYKRYIQKKSATLNESDGRKQRKTKPKMISEYSNLDHEGDLKDQLTINHPGTHYIGEDTTVQLICQTSDVSDIPVTWYKDGVPMNKPLGRQLLISKFCYEMEGTYECRKHNPDRTWTVKQFTLYLKK